MPVNDREAMKQRHPSSTRTACARSGKPQLSLSPSSRRRVMDGASGAFHGTQKAGTGGLARVVCMCQMEVTSLACLPGERRGRAVCVRISSGECATQGVSSSLCEPLRRHRRTPGFVGALSQNALAHADGCASAGLGRWTRSEPVLECSVALCRAPLHPRPALRRPEKQLQQRTERNDDGRAGGAPRSKRALPWRRSRPAAPLAYIRRSDIDLVLDAPACWERAPEASSSLAAPPAGAPGRRLRPRALSVGR